MYGPITVINTPTGLMVLVDPIDVPSAYPESNSFDGFGHRS